MSSIALNGFHHYDLFKARAGPVGRGRWYVDHVAQFGVTTVFGGSAWLPLAPVRKRWRRMMKGG